MLLFSTHDCDILYVDETAVSMICEWAERPSTAPPILSTFYFCRVLQMSHYRQINLGLNNILFTLINVIRRPNMEYFQKTKCHQCLTRRRLLENLDRLYELFSRMPCRIVDSVIVDGTAYGCMVVSMLLMLPQVMLMKGHAKLHKQNFPHHNVHNSNQRKIHQSQTTQANWPHDNNSCKTDILKLFRS